MNGNSDEIQRAYLDRFAIEWRHIGSCDATTECEVFGRKLATPVMCGGMAHYERMNEGGRVAFAEGAKAAGTAIFTGMSSNEELESVLAVGAPAGRIIKPFADRDKVVSLIRHDAVAGACAFAMDIDHVYKKDGSRYEFFGDPLEPQTEETLRLYAGCSDLPFYPKGILSVRDAEICAKAGCEGIIISSHQNMFPWCPPTLKVLREVKAALGNDLKIIVDSCFETGYDVFKALAFGADGVFIARSLREDFTAKGAEGVAAHINKVTDELRGCLAKTGSKDIYHIDPSCVVEI